MKINFNDALVSLKSGLQEQSWSNILAVSGLIILTF